MAETASNVPSSGVSNPDRNGASKAAGSKASDDTAKRKSQKTQNFLLSCFLPPDSRTAVKKFEGCEARRASKHGGKIFCSEESKQQAIVLDTPVKSIPAADSGRGDSCMIRGAEDEPRISFQESLAEEKAETTSLGKVDEAVTTAGKPTAGEPTAGEPAAPGIVMETAKSGGSSEVNQLEGLEARNPTSLEKVGVSNSEDAVTLPEKNETPSIRAEGLPDLETLALHQESSHRSPLQSPSKSASSDAYSQKCIAENPDSNTTTSDQSHKSEDQTSNSLDSVRNETPALQTGPEASAVEDISDVNTLSSARAEAHLKSGATGGDVEEGPAGVIELETRESQSSSVSALSVVSPATLQGEAVMAWIRSQLIGINADITTPFGTRQMTYADYIASGRCLQYVEDLLQARVLPYYGNTHTEDSECGQRTTHFAHEAGEYIKRCVRAGREHKILFCGSGFTAAVKKLQEVMGIAVPSTLRARVIQTLNPSERWVVFMGPYEHHSNLLTWRQSLADVVEIPLSENGLLDLANLETELQDRRWEGRPKLGSFSAASNVTGVLTDTRALARMLHKHGAYACLDFAAAAPYVDIDMRAGQPDGYDALLVSPHKFVGGPGSAGILILSEALYSLAGQAPSTSGGGTVNYVNGHDEKETLYVADIEQREDAGTPPILQKMRAGFAFWVKECVGAAAIERAESALIRAALARLGRNPRVELLGNCEVRRLAVISFLIRPFSTSTSDRGGKALNGRFVVNLLNDLFGIQARGGCSCAGPYGHALMKVDRQLSMGIRDAIAAGNDSVKPGWTRLGFAYFITPAEFDFILSAIEFVVEHGIRFLPLYDFDWKTGNWQCRGFQPQNNSLFDAVTVDEAAVLCNARADMFEAHANKADAPPFKRYLDEARALAATLPLTAGTDRARGPGIDERIVTFVV